MLQLFIIVHTDIIYILYSNDIDIIIELTHGNDVNLIENDKLLNE